MFLRRSLSAALAVAVAIACAPSVPNTPPPTTVVYAVSFPDTSDGTQALSPPVPNDLVLQAGTAATPSRGRLGGAGSRFFKHWRRVGGFPNDQEVVIQVKFFGVNSQTGAMVTTFPDIDTTTITRQYASGHSLRHGHPCAPGCSLRWRLRTTTPRRVSSPSTSRWIPPRAHAGGPRRRVVGAT